MPVEGETMNLSAPTQIIYIIAVVLAIIAVLAYLGVLTFIPALLAYSFWIMTIAFVLLAGACLMRGA
jgi:hypothetical protein